MYDATADSCVQSLPNKPIPLSSSSNLTTNAYHICFEVIVLQAKLYNLEVLKCTGNIGKHNNDFHIESRVRLAPSLAH